MDEKKQIEEMAKYLTHCFMNCAACDKCRAYVYSEQLYDAGYIKQTETMRNRYDEICDTYGYHDLYASGYDDVVDAVENAPTADVAPRAEVAREVLNEVRQAVLSLVLANAMGQNFDIEKRFSEIEKKYTEEKHD